MAIVGMSAFFAATVRAPVTGIVLVVEMTATTSVLVPMLAATAAAVLAAELLRSPPIYDSLRERMPAEPTRPVSSVPRSALREFGDRLPFLPRLEAALVVGLGELTAATRRRTPAAAASRRRRP